MREYIEFGEDLGEVEDIYWDSAEMQNVVNSYIENGDYETAGYFLWLKRRGIDNKLILKEFKGE